jgi:DNA modification methylase
VGKKALLLKDAAQEIGVAPITLKRWLLSGKVSDVKRNRNGWRIFNDSDIIRIKRYAEKVTKPPVQTSLPGHSPKNNDKTAAFRDSAFNGNKKLPFHRWVPWIAGFSAEFVEDCFNKYLPEGKPSDLTILDPFAGVGTTLVEGLLHGYNVTGFEINPYAYLACKVKLSAYKYDIGEIQKTLKRFLSYYKKRTEDESYIPRTPFPKGFNTRAPFYSPKVERKVLIFFDYLPNIKDLEIRDLFKLAFGTVMVSFSNYSYEPSLGQRVSSGKSIIEDAEVETVIAGKIQHMIDDIIEFDELHSESSKGLETRIYNESFFDALEFCNKESIDLLVTSPPYLNNYHYLRNTRPQLHWLELARDKESRKDIEHSSFGKFWQTVRAQDTIKPDFELKRLEDKLDVLRVRNPEKKVYGGHGWANYAATYFNDSYRFCKVVKEIMKPGGRAVVVIGNSILQGIEIKTDEIFADIGELAGLKKEDIILLRTKRTGSSIIDSTVRAAKTKKKTILYETAVVLKK